MARPTLLSKINLVAAIGARGRNRGGEKEKNRGKRGAQRAAKRINKYRSTARIDAPLLRNAAREKLCAREMFAVFRRTSSATTNKQPRSKNKPNPGLYKSSDEFASDRSWFRGGGERKEKKKKNWTICASSRKYIIRVERSYRAIKVRTKLSGRNSR